MMSTRSPVGLCVALVTLLGGCSSDGKKDAPAECKENIVGNDCVVRDRPTGVTSYPDDEGNEVAEPESGFQFETAGIVMSPGDDDEWCETMIVPGSPGEEYYIGRFEVAMTEGYHHLFVAKCPEGGTCEGLMEEGSRVRCVGGAHVAYGADLLAIPLPQGRYEEVVYPEGIGLRLQGGQKISVNYHYLNTGDDSIDARVKLNFHSIPPETFITEMRQFGFYNYDIAIPAKGTYSTVMEKTFSQDVYVQDLFRHTHRLGGDFPVYFFQGARDGDNIFLSTNYEDDPGYTFGLSDPAFEGPQLFKAGEGLGFVCNFENDRDVSVGFGPSADDEMCMLLGTYWQANPDEEPLTQHRNQTRSPR